VSELNQNINFIDLFCEPYRCTVKFCCQNPVISICVRTIGDVMSWELPMLILCQVSVFPWKFATITNRMF